MDEKQYLPGSALRILETVGKRPTKKPILATNVPINQTLLTVGRDNEDIKEESVTVMNSEEIEELQRWLKKYTAKQQFEQDYAKDLKLMANAQGQAPEKYFQPDKKTDIFDEFAEGKVELQEFLEV